MIDFCIDCRLVDWCFYVTSGSVYATLRRFIVVLLQTCDIVREDDSEAGGYVATKQGGQK